MNNCPQITVETPLGKLRLCFGSPVHVGIRTDADEIVINGVAYSAYARCTLEGEEWKIDHQGTHGTRRAWKNNSYNQSLLQGPARKKFIETCLKAVVHATLQNPDLLREAWIWERDAQLERMRNKLDTLMDEARRINSLIQEEVGRTYPTPMPEIKL